MSWIASTAYGAIGGAIAGSGDGFQPYPNHIMPPFMAYQSAMMAFDFGQNYEMGKRTVKSLPNELFNDIRSGSPDPINVTWDGQEYTIKKKDLLTFWQKKRNQEMLTLFRERLPDASESLRNDIIPSMVDIEFEKAKIKPEMYVRIIDGVIQGIRELRDAGATEDNLLQFLLDFFFGGSYWSTNPIDTNGGTTEEPPTTNEGPTKDNLLYNPYDLTNFYSQWADACTQETKSHTDQGTLAHIINHVEYYKTSAEQSNTTCAKDTHLLAYSAHKQAVADKYGWPYDQLKQAVDSGTI